MRDRFARLEEPPAIRERVWCDVENAHDKRAAVRQQFREHVGSGLLRRSGTNFERSGYSHAGRFARSAGGCQAREDASVRDF